MSCKFGTKIRHENSELKTGTDWSTALFQAGIQREMRHVIGHWSLFTFSSAFKHTFNALLHQHLSHTKMNNY